MLQPVEGLAPDVVAFEAHGEVTAEDYSQRLTPAVETALEQHGRVRFLYVLGPAFEKFSAGAAWADTRLGFSHLHEFERIAIVTDHDWVERSVRAFGAFIPCPVRVFSIGQLEQARAWVSERPADEFRIEVERAGSLARIHVVLRGALDHESEERLVRAAEEGLGDAPQVRALVEAVDFHGWRDLRSLWQHLRFLAGKRAVLERVAIVGEAKWQRRLVATAKHVLRVEARFFEPTALEEAKAWLAA